MHGGRVAYCVTGEGILVDPAAGGGPPAAGPLRVSPLRFGRLFGRARDMSPAAGKALHDKLVALGLCINDPEKFCGQPPPPDDGESDISAGYTYLGQFIAHEITFDSTGDLLAEGKPFENLRTPQIDLDSLYGDLKGPSKRKELYEADSVHLKVGKTFSTSVADTFDNDLPRDRSDPENPRRALIGDARNDENLPLAQTHVAFIRFHNKVVDSLVEEGHTKDGLFECARITVIRHFQWIILHDYLPRLVDKGVLDCVLRHGLRWFRPAGEDGLFMPLEFSAAAFRIGHSMVRRTYEWNTPHSTRMLGPVATGAPADIIMLFKQTGRSGDLGGLPALGTDWVIDWRRFYDFSPLADANIPPVPKINRTSKLDTLLNFDLGKAGTTGNKEPAVDERLKQMQQAIAVRNLLRGFYLGLPTGEEVAKWIGEMPLAFEQVSAGPHRELLGDPVLRGKTPLWYYVLKEAELLGLGMDGKGGHRLGPVGSRIVAETLVGLIKNSHHSILDDPDWRPRFGRTTATGEVLFEMIDLLKFADVISPIP